MVRKAYSLIFAFFLIMITSCSREESIQLHDVQGNTVKSTDFKGKWVILNYWAAWCGSCAAEIPKLNHFYLQNKDKNIIFYGVNFDELPLVDLQQAMKKINIAFPVLLENPAALWQLDAVEALPTTYIINPAGRVVKKMVGMVDEKYLIGIDK